ncbi:TRI39 ligase, partial [Polypterus senegalus]
MVSFSARFSVVGPSYPIITYVGDEVMLPAFFSPELNAQGFDIKWTTPKSSSPVLLYQNNSTINRIESYMGRTVFSRENLKYGNVSLIIRNVRVSDGDLYKCLVFSKQWEDEARINLIVEADVTFDPETASPWLIVSEDGKEVRHVEIRQTVADNPKRFDGWVNVLAREGFTSGRHYWEVEVGEETAWDLGVTRESADRKGWINLSPYDGYWSVVLRNSNVYEACDNSIVSFSLGVMPRTVGIFLDYNEGQVSFYNAQSRSHMYIFTDSFTETLYPFFGPCLNDADRRAAPLVIRPLCTQ